MPMTEGGWPPNTSGGVSGPATPPAPTAAIGETYSQTPIGRGQYRLSAASIHTTNNFNEEARISLVYLSSNGTETEMCLESGEVSQYKPFSLSTERVVAGPGFIRGYVVNLNATSFTFNVSVDKIEETKEATTSKGRFGTWFQ